MIKTYEVKSDFSNMRLDRWYKKSICQVPQSLLEKSIRKGKIKVNKQKKKGSYKLQINDKITINNFFPEANKNKKILNIYKPTKKELLFSSNNWILGIFT